MTDAQKAHLARIITEFELSAREKYTKGAAEHGGNLWDLSPLQLVEHAIEECIDQFQYLVTARERILAQDRQRAALDGDRCECWCGRRFTSHQALFDHVNEFHSQQSS